MLLTSKIKTKPIIYSTIIVVLVYLIQRIPIKDIFEICIGLNKYISKSYDTIVTNIVCVVCLFLLMKNERIQHHLFLNKVDSLKYYLPLIFYILIFSGGFKDFTNINFLKTDLSLVFIYTLKRFSSAFLEEFLFRGFIFGLFVTYFPKNKKGLLKSAFWSSIMFGFLHIMNVWTNDNETIEGVLNQIYAATCIGFLFAATYIKTRSLLLLGIIHFLINFFSMINELNLSEQVNKNTTEIISNPSNNILEIILKFIIFGIPLFMGYFMLNQSDEKDYTFFE